MPDATPTPRRAVFLSYAREDAGPARTLAEALRAAGIEVWFDQNELRGGDLWDQKIRRQVRECALFLPIVSQNSQARGEGYFRREWKMAVERMQDMSATMAFVVPVIIDRTPEAEADIPPEFLRSHCERMPGGEPSPEFVAQVLRLLDSPRSSPGLSRPRDAPLPAAAPRRPSARRGPVVAAAVLLILGGVLLWRWRDGRPPPAPAPSAEAAVPAAPKADTKSVAVLPFLDMSPGKDQEFLADGMTEEILNLLAQIRGLRVTSRSSAFALKHSTLTVAEIARRLHVDYVLEGSVRKSDNLVRITAQLIEAGSDQHLWSRTYDRPLNDLFDLQDEIALTVAAQLKVTLLGARHRAEKTTPEAYERYLQAAHLLYRGQGEQVAEVIRLLRECLADDPRYVPGWNLLAEAYMARSGSNLTSTVAITEDLRLAQEAVDRSLALDPNYAHTYLAKANLLLYSAGGDSLAEAARAMERALALEPNNPGLVGAAASIAASLGRLEQTVQLREFAIARDPLIPALHLNLAMTYVNSRRFTEGLDEAHKALELAPKLKAPHIVAGWGLLAKGDPAGALAEFQAAPPAWRQIGFPMAYHGLGRKAESDAVLAELIRDQAGRSPFNIACVYAYRGQTDEAFAWLDKAVALHDPQMAFVMNEIMLAGLRGDPRWQPLLRRVGKAPEQLAAIKFDIRPPQ